MDPEKSIIAISAPTNGRSGLPFSYTKNSILLLFSLYVLLKFTHWKKKMPMSRISQKKVHFNLKSYVPLRVKVEYFKNIKIILIK